jgi:hypothetical protein
MQSAEQLVPIGERLVILARELTDDTNETYLLAHKALRALLRTDRSLGDAELGDLRGALLIAAEALGIAPDDAVAPAGLQQMVREAPPILRAPVCGQTDSPTP